MSFGLLLEQEINKASVSPMNLPHIPYAEAKLFSTYQEALFAKLYYERIHKDELSKL